MNLQNLGWNTFFEENFALDNKDGNIPGRIIRETMHIYDVETENGTVSASVSGKIRYNAESRASFPTVGDWVVLRSKDNPTIIERILSRRSALSRKTSGVENNEQIIAGNIDYICIVCALDGGRSFNLRGIERLLAIAHSSGATPVMVLNKSDMCNAIDDAVKAAESVAHNVSVFAVSAIQHTGIDSLLKIFPSHSTIAFLGASGVGKSALVNALSGKTVSQTGTQRQSDLRGRHTTSHKELFFIQDNLMAIDTPGLRELSVWSNEHTMIDAFPDIDDLSKECRFADCTHQSEPGCAIHQALSDGLVDFARFQNYLDIRNEKFRLDANKNEKANQKLKQKNLSKLIKKHYKGRNDYFE